MSGIPADGIRLVDKTLAELNDQEVRALRRLNMGPNGSMRYNFDYYLKYDPKRARAIFLYDRSRRVIAWTLLFPPHYGRVAHFYTRASHRRRGYATMLAQHIRSNYRKIEVCPWDLRSSLFFQALRFQPAPGYSFSRA